MVLLSIDVVEQTSDHLMEMLSEHTLDLAIGRFTDVTQSQFFDFQPLNLNRSALLSIMRTHVPRKVLYIRRIIKMVVGTLS